MYACPSDMADRRTALRWLSGRLNLLSAVDHRAWPGENVISAAWEEPCPLAKPYPNLQIIGKEGIILGCDF